MRTPLYDIHVGLGAKMVDFNGWEMPLYYSGIIKEHQTVRSAAGIFDLCHMARIHVPAENMDQLQYCTTNDIKSLKNGRAHYSLVCDNLGGVIDDILVYKNGKDYFVVANAGNREAVLNALEEDNVTDLTEKKGMIAVQGPKSEDILCELFGKDIASINSYAFSFFSLCGDEVMVSRTGYTGEDGFELYFDAGKCQSIWEALMERGANWGLQPVGLGARDTLRLEAGMPLYGHELDLTIDPFEAGLGNFVCLDKPFRGREALVKYSQEKPMKQLKGLVSEQKAIPREGYKVFRNDQCVGEITSGSYSPALDKSIGMAYIEQDFCRKGKELEVQIRKRKIPFKLTELPFYKKEE